MLVFGVQMSLTDCRLSFFLGLFVSDKYYARKLRKPFVGQLAIGLTVRILINCSVFILHHPLVEVIRNIFERFFLKKLNINIINYGLKCFFLIFCC